MSKKYIDYSTIYFHVLIIASCLHLWMCNSHLLECDPSIEPHVQLTLCASNYLCEKSKVSDMYTLVDS